MTCPDVPKSVAAPRGAHHRATATVGRAYGHRNVGARRSLLSVAGRLTAGGVGERRALTSVSLEQRLVMLFKD